jgi:hypothetical protein
MHRRVIAATVALCCAMAGAAQAAAPNATTGAATNVTTTTAVLHGTVNPRGTETSYYFEYGLNAKYGSRTASRSAGNSNSAAPVQAAAGGLLPGTRYHYRLVAIGDGMTRGADRVLTTSAAIIPQPSKLELARATINRSGSWIDILAPITARASGSVSIELFAARQVHRWTAPIDAADGRVRDRETIPAAQAAMGTGILTMRYAGDADTRPQVVRLRAANVQAELDASRPTIVNGRLQASGTISSAARGRVRVQLEYYSAGKTTLLEKYAPIANGRWQLDEPLAPAEQTAIAARAGVVHSYILFTGYLPAKMRGEMQSYEVLGPPSA